MAAAEEVRKEKYSGKGKKGLKLKRIPPNSNSYSKTTHSIKLKIKNQIKLFAQSVGLLLTEFFRYYAFEFDYRKHVISVGMGGVVDKTLKGEIDCWPVKNGLAIEDPFETFYDVGHVVKTKNHAHIRQEFALAYTKIADVVYGGNSMEEGGKSIVKGNLNELFDYLCEGKEGGKEGKEGKEEGGE